MSDSMIYSSLQDTVAAVFSRQLTERLGWTLIHSTWQAALVAGVLAVLLQLTRRRSAQARYLLATGALCVIAALAPVTFFTRRPAQPTIPQATPAGPALVKGLMELERPRNDGSKSQRGDDSGEWTEVGAGGDALVDTGVAARANEIRSRGAGEAAVGSGRTPGLAADFGESANGGVAARSRWQATVEPWLGTVVTLWLLGVVCFSLRPLAGWWSVRRYACRGVSPAPAALERLLAELSRRLQVDRATRLVLSTLVDAPATIGWLAPLILLPESMVTTLTLPQWEAILAHELAHIRRRDYLVNLLQMVVETLGFHHPAVWSVSSTMRRLREECCDDLALEATGDRAGYARALVAVEQHRASTPSLALSVRGGGLLARIQRVMGKEPASGVSLLWTAPALLVLIALFAVWVGAERGGIADDTRPASAPVLWLRDLAGKPLSGMVVMGRVGYGDGTARLPSWFAQADGTIQLEGLPAGRHTVVVWQQEMAVQASVESPTKAEPTVVKARAVPEWYGFRERAEPEFRGTVEEQGDLTFLSIEVTNRADKPITLDVRDVSLTTATWRIFPPASAWSGERHWPAHSTRKFRLSWTSIVREGLWAPRYEEISEPWPAEEELETHRYVRVRIGRSGTLPLLVPRPERVLAGLTKGSDTPKPDNSTPAGQITGRIRFAGARPAETVITFAKPDLEAWKRDGRRGDSPHRPSGPQLHFHQNYSQTKIVDESVIVGEEGGLANVLVWLRSKTPNYRYERKDQKEKPNSGRLEIHLGRFSPHVLAFPAWDGLAIHNRDPGSTQVVGNGLASDPFNRLLKSGETVKAPMRAEKVPIYVTSNIAPWMSAYVLPLDHPFHAVTGEDGRFEIAGIPAGEWELVFWHAGAGWLKSDQIPTGRRLIQVAQEKIDLGELTVGHSLLAPLLPGNAPSSKASLPLGNFGGIPQLATRRLLNNAPTDAAARSPVEMAEGEWTQAEYGVEYRVTFAKSPDQNGENPKYTEDELPLARFEIRNHGGPEQSIAFDLGIESHQTQHRLLVDGVEYARNDQPWGGLDRLQVGGAAVTFPVLLSPDWHSTVRDNSQPLKLAPGSHRLSLQVTLFEMQSGVDEQGKAKWTIKSGGERSIVTQPIDFEVLPRASKEPRATAIKNIEQELAVFPKFHAAAVSKNLRQLTLDNRPDSIARLLTLVRDGTMDAPDPASSVFAAIWESLDRDERLRYLRASMSSFALTRAWYPAGADTAIAVGVRFRSDYAGLPRNREISSETLTTAYLDGEPVGEPFKYPLHTTVSHWISTGSLQPGKHTIRLATDYQFRDREEEYKGRAESPEYSFDILNEKLPNTLAAPVTAELRRQFDESFTILEKMPLANGENRSQVDAVASGSEVDRLWPPLIRWNAQGEEPAWGLHVPHWRLAAALPVDLCFRVEWQIEKTGEWIACSDLVVRAGQLGVGHFYPISDSPPQLRKTLLSAADEEGFVKLRVRLVPSHELALTRTEVERYFDAAITSDVIRARVSAK